MPIPATSPAFPPPLPRTPNKVANVTFTGEVHPGDILIVGSAVMQANTPIITLNIAQLDPASFWLDTSLNPPVIKLVVAVP